MSQGRLAIALAPCARGRRRGIVCTPEGGVCQQCGGEIGEQLAMKVTGSKFPIVIACPASAALPQIEQPVGRPAINGHVTHRFLEVSASDGREAALLDAPEAARPFLKSVDLDRLPTHLMPEAAFALDWKRRTARFLGTRLGRAYPETGPTEAPLTIDLFGLGEEAVFVGDYKTGRTRYGNPERFAQLLGAAMAACLAYDRKRAVVALYYVDHHGEAYPVTGQVDEWDLEAFALELETAMDRVGEAKRLVMAGGTPDVRPGDHCDYCPAYRACPDKVGLVRNFPGMEIEVTRPGYLAPDRLAETWHKIQKFRELLGVIESEIRACSMREPIDLGNGWELSPKETQREEFDAAVAGPVLASFLGKDAADAAIEVSITKAAIEEAAKKWRADKGEKYDDGSRIVLESKRGDGLLDRIHAEIRARGGNTVKITNNPTVHKRKA